MIGQFVKWGNLIGGDTIRSIPGVQVGVGHILPGLGVDVRDGVDLLLGVGNNKVVITPVVREPVMMCCVKELSLNDPPATDLFAMLLSLLCFGTNCDLGLGVLGLASARGCGLRLASCLSSEDAGEAGDERPESEAEPEPWTWGRNVSVRNQTNAKTPLRLLSIKPCGNKTFLTISLQKFSTNILKIF